MTEINSGSQPGQYHNDLFFTLLTNSLAQNAFVKLLMGKYCGEEVGLERVFVRRLTVRNEDCLSFLYRYKTKDITKNLPVTQAIDQIRDLFGKSFKNLHLQTLNEDVQLTVSKKGKMILQRGKASAPRSITPQEHDRAKNRYLDLGRPFLAEIGVTDKRSQLLPTMAKKWKQINKFVEIIDQAFAASALKKKESVQVVDFGSGKGYLTFAVEDYLRNNLGVKAGVTGVELRQDLVKLCAGVAKRLKLDNLSFKHGDIRSYKPAEGIDIMIALHACDMATDYAIHLGISADAEIIMCAPCCHKQVRPQMQSPPVLQPMLKHGIHMGQEAEMVTDSLRALLLEACGYDTQVFEFVALEHTSKNKMILGVKGTGPVKRDEILAGIKAIKEFYGIKEHCLESLLRADGRC